jgi:hypothetical protein
MEPFTADARITVKIVAAGLHEGVFFDPGGDGLQPRTLIALIRREGEGQRSEATFKT